LGGAARRWTTGADWKELLCGCEIGAEVREWEKERLEKELKEIWEEGYYEDGEEEKGISKTGIVGH